MISATLIYNPMIKLLTICTLACLLLSASSQTIVVNYGCKAYSKDGSKCALCADRFYMDGSGVCQKVSSDCKTYSPESGACLTCYEGYFLADVICVQGQSPASTIDPYCAKVVNDTCTKCVKGFYLQEQACLLIDPLCKNYDLSKMVCNECYSGFSVDSSGYCMLTKEAPSLVGCSQLKDSVCLKCSKGYYFNPNKVCVEVDSNCKTHDESNGACLSCYPGFTLSSGACLVDNSTAYNPYCQKFEDSKCVSCSKGYYFDSSRICQEVDPLCKVFDYSKATCTACYSGFTLTNNTCLFVETTAVSDPNCRKFDASGKCLNCSNGYYFNSNSVCTMIEASCKKFDQVKLACVQCYSGYDLQEGQCRLSASKNSASACAEWLDNVCVKCSLRFYFDFEANCVQVSDHCNTYNVFSGHCTTCYPGYSLDPKGACNPSEANSSCAQVDKQTGLCAKCFNGSYLSAAGQCLPIDPYCSSFNYQTYQCSSCYRGYGLTKEGACKEQATAVTNTIQNCVEYDSEQKCVKCYNLYYLASNACLAVSPLCKTYDPANGRCLSCYSFFALKDGACALQ